MDEHSFKVEELLKFPSFFSVSGTFPDTREEGPDFWSQPDITSFYTVKFDGDTITVETHGLSNHEVVNTEDYDGRVCGGEVFLYSEAKDSGIAYESPYTMQFFPASKAEFLIESDFMYNGKNYRLVIPMYED